MRESRQWTREQLAEELGIVLHSVDTLLKLGNYKRRNAQVLPHSLTCEQKKNRKDVCKRNLKSYNSDNSIINRIISIDESWVRCYEPLSRTQASEYRRPGETPPQIVRSELNDWKMMLVIAVQGNQIIAHEILRRKENMNSACFLRFLQDSLRPALERLRIERPLLLMDNAR